MTKRLPPLNALRAFEAVARLGSVTRAAGELGRTHGAVSRQLRSLHEFGGIAFFEKEGTGLRLNRHGEALQAVARRLFEEMEQGWRRIVNEAGGLNLHVACSATFAMRWLVPRLAAFYRDHPDIRLQLSMTSAGEIRHQGADLVIAWDRAALPDADGGAVIPLAPVRFGPVCAPDYPLARDGRTLNFTTRIAHAFTTRAWAAWGEVSGLETRHEAERRFPHTHLCIEAALAGLGVALVESRMVRDDLALGRLVAPCGFAALADSLVAVPAAGRGRSTAATAFITWLEATLMGEEQA